MRQVTVSQCGHALPDNRTLNPTMSEKNATAYDPIEDVDVPIRCCDKHQRTDSEYIDGESLPVTIDSDFRHDPVEGCQGSYTSIIEIEDGCPNCGYDRANASHHTLAGVHRETCRACGVDITDRHRDEWEPTHPTDPVDRIKRSAEYVAKTSKDGVSVYRRNDRLFSLVDGNQRNPFTLNRDELVSLLLIVLRTYDEEDDPLPNSSATHLLRTICDIAEKPDDEEGNDD